VPGIAEFSAPAPWQAIDLVSDLHLSEATPRTFDAWAAHLLHTDADAVWLLGDLFEVWVGDDARDLPFEALCLDVLARAAARRAVGFMVGNRDFLVGAPLLRSIGVQPLADPTLLEAFGTRVLLTHGDALCLEDRAYQAFRAQVRDPAWQADVLGRPLAERLQVAEAMRERSTARKRALPDPSLWADVDTSCALQWLHAARSTTLIHGHTHRPGVHELASGFERLVLADWDLDGDRPRAEVLRITAAGIERRAPTAGAA
jgi:UDP-2,3-diacylglucosamine hydrolase